MRLASTIRAPYILPRFPYPRPQLPTFSLSAAESHINGCRPEVAVSRVYFPSRCLAGDVIRLPAASEQGRHVCFYKCQLQFRVESDVSVAIIVLTGRGRYFQRKRRRNEALVGGVSPCHMLVFMIRRMSLKFICTNVACRKKAMSYVTLILKRVKSQFKALSHNIV